MSQRCLPSLAAVVTCTACLTEPQIDLEAPRLLRLELESGERLVAGRRLSTAPVFELLASEPIDPDSIGPGSLVLRTLAEGDVCGPLDLCEEGRCRFGSCVASDLSASELSAIGRGDYSGDAESFGREAAMDWELIEGIGGAPTRLRVWPTRALRGESAYELLIGGLRDRSGIPMQSWLDDEALIRWSFDTRSEGSGGPELHFARPLAGSRSVPINLGFVDTYVVGELDLQDEAGLSARLESERGGSVELRAATPCPDMRPGSCLRWEVAEPFEPNTRYRIGPSDLRDRQGRGALLPADGAWFQSSMEPDLQAPQLEVESVARGHCVELSVHADEFVYAQLDVAQRTHSEWFSGVWRLGLTQLPVAHSLSWYLVAADLAGNQQELSGELPGPASAFSGVAITEVLANPLGSEPAAEFVELYVAGEAPFDSDGVYLADLPWEQVRAALEAGEGAPGDPLPPLSLQPGELALVVADSYPGAEAAGDPVAPESTPRLRIGSSLGEGGLKNVGEPLTLYRLDPPTLLSSYGNWIETDASDLGGVSVQRRSPEGCDLLEQWQLAPGGRATPGTLP